MPLWPTHKKKRRKDEDTPSSLTTGQRMDMGEIAIDIATRGGVKGPVFTPASVGMGMVDVGISTATARPGEKGTAGLSAAAAQTAGMVGWTVGRTVGTAVGAVVGQFLLPIPVVGAEIGAVVGGFIGAGAGSMTADKVTRTGTTRTLHRLQQTRGQVRFGGFRDTIPAYTMRQRAEQELSGSLLNARQYLGKEAQLMHQ